MKPTKFNQDVIWDHFQNEGVDSFEQSQGRLEFLVDRLQSRERVLNVGVGNGMLEKLAVAKGVDIWSLDPSERAIEHLRTVLFLGEKAEVGYCQSMPFSDEFFDAVVMSEVLEHLDVEVFDATLAEIKRILRPGGQFIGTVPARERLENSTVVCPQCGIKFHRWGHKRSFDVKTLGIALERYLLVNSVHEEFFIDWKSVGWWRKLLGLIKKFLSWQGIGTYGICRNIFFSAQKST